MSAAPRSAACFVADQLEVSPDEIQSYARREQTRRQHFTEVREHLGFSMLRSRDLEELEAWLVERVLEHDAPKVLFRLARERLRTERLVFPAPDRIVRLVSSARGRAQERTYTLVEPLLSAERRAQLDGLLEAKALEQLVDPQVARAGCFWREPYTWTSDQYSQYGSKVISSTVRDATYVLDEILEHTTDTAGYTEIVFASRIRGLGRSTLVSSRCSSAERRGRGSAEGIGSEQDPTRQLGRTPPGGRLTQVGLGDRIAPDFEAPDWRKRERLVPSPPRSRVPRQDPVHPKVD